MSSSHVDDKHADSAGNPPVRDLLRGEQSDPRSDFVETREYLLFAEFCDSVARYRYVGVCVGPPGVGKTRSSRRYCSWDILEPLFPRYAYTEKPPVEVAACRSLFYTPPVANSPNTVAGEIERRRGLLNWLVEAARRAERDREKASLNIHRKPMEVSEHVDLLIVDEANRLSVASLEQLRDLYDREGFGLVLLGMPGLEKTLARYPQLYSRVGFVHRFGVLRPEEARKVIVEESHRLGVDLGPEAFADEESLAVMIRHTGGNFRLIQRLLQQIERVMDVNDLAVASPEVVETARESLVIGLS